MHRFLSILIAGLLFGCNAPEEPGPPVVNVDEAMTYLEAGLRPEVLLFPEYLLMEDFELHRHGRIPESGLVGAGMQAKLDLNVTRGRLMDALDSNGWKTDNMEIGKQSFRLMASWKDQELEIRGVQGTGVTQVFLLYHPGGIIPPADEPEPMDTQRRSAGPRR